MLKKKIEKLIALIENTEIEEIEVSSFWGAQKIRLSKGAKNKVLIPPESNQSNQPEEESVSVKNKNNYQETSSLENKEEASFNKEEVSSNTEENYEDETKFKIITAPLVGTFYSCPKPGDPSFVKIGDTIDVGNIVCIIEAMKIFNDIDSEYRGELVHVYVEDGTPVEYGQELFVLRISNV